MVSANTATHFAYAIPSDRPAGRWEGQTIVMHNYRRPLAKRRDDRRHVGPYMWAVPKLGAERKGRGFYFANTAELAIGDATFSLRIHEANDFLRGTWLARTSGYYAAPEYQDDAIIPYVVRLPNGRGFWPAYGEGRGMWGAVDYDTYETAEEAARAAHQLAEDAAVREQEHREEQDRLEAEAEGEDDDAAGCTIEHGEAPCGLDRCVCMEAIGA